MEQDRLSFLLGHFRKRVATPEMAGDTDRQLLGCFAACRDQAAFSALVERHGPLVLSVCRRILASEQDAEDAFQATFLVLALKAGSLHWQDSVASWLHEVASRLAMKAKVRNARRQQLPREAEVMATNPAAEAACRETQALVDEELRRLPEKYRLPLARISHEC